MALMFALARALSSETAVGYQVREDCSLLASADV